MIPSICTVLLISYNHSKYIKKAIESVLEQKTEYNFIIKIFDDASTDGTQQIIKEFAEKYPDKLFPYLEDENIGAQANILRAYKSVDTKYFAILECDDYWSDKGKLQIQIDALEKYKECTFSSHNTMLCNIDDEYRKKEDKKVFVNNKKMKNVSLISLDDIREFKYDYISHISSRMIRTNAIDWNKLKNIEDLLYDNCQFYYLLLKGKMYYIDKVMSVYNMNNASSFSGAKISKKIRVHLENLIEFNKNTNYVIEDIIYLHLLQFVGYWTYLADKPKNKKESIYKCLKSIKHYFIPRFILDIFDLPRDIIRLIKK